MNRHTKNNNKGGEEGRKKRDRIALFFHSLILD